MNPNDPTQNTSGGLNLGNVNLGVNQNLPQDLQPLPNQLTQPTPAPQQLDPSIVALTKSIGLAESNGKYDQPSADGKSIPSAYQFTPGFISEYAPKYLKNYDPNNLTPQQQDELAYNVVKEWGTTGNKYYPHLGKLSPSQIASAWNAGDPDAYLEEGGHAGETDNGTPYNTAQFVRNVQQFYDQQPKSDYSFTPGISDFDKSVTIPGAAVLGTGLLAAGGAALGGLGAAGAAATGAAEAGATATPGILGRLWKGITGAFAPEAVGSAIAQGATKSVLQNILPQGQADFASKILGSALPQASDSSNKLASALTESLARLPTGRVMLQDPLIKESINTGAKYGLPPDTDENGNMDFSSALKGAKDNIEKLSQANESVLKDEYANFEQAIENAKKNVEEHTPNDLQKEALNTIDTEADKYRKFVDENGNIPLDKLEVMKREQWHRFEKSDSTGRRQGRKALGFGARQTITDNTQHKDFYNAAMREEQRLINYGKVAKRLNGKKAPTRFDWKREVIKTGAHEISTWLGARIGGPIGAVLGDIVGQHLAGNIDKAHGRNIFESPQVQRAIFEIKKDHPEVFERLVEELQKEGIKVKIEADKKILKLQAPKGIPLGSYKGKDESVVVGGKTPPATLEQAKKRKRGEPEFGGLHGYLIQQEEMRKAAGLPPVKKKT